MHPINLDDLSDVHLNILVYGEPGVGKTHFLGSVGECLYTLAVDVDNGFKTLRKVPKAWRDNLYPIRLTDFSDIDKLYKLCLKNDPDRWAREFNGGLKPGDEGYVPVREPFQAVAIDTWSELNWVVKEAKRKQLGKDGGGSLGWRDNIQIQDWGNILDLHQLALEAFRDLDMTFLCCMHEQVVQDEKTKIIRGMPSLNGKLAAELGKYFDVVGHMSVTPQGKYVMNTRATARYQAKSRIAIDRAIQDPTFKLMLEAAQLIS